MEDGYTWMGEFHIAGALHPAQSSTIHPLRCSHGCAPLAHALPGSFALQNRPNGNQQHFRQIISLVDGLCKRHSQKFGTVV